MKASMLDLRRRMRDVLRALDRNESVTIYYRGKEKAVLSPSRQRTGKSVMVTYAEFIQGVRNRQELKKIKNLLNDLAFQTLPLTENIGHRASVYMEEYTLKTALCLADALIAATAVEHRLTLCTVNRKHYREINGLNLQIFRS